MELEISPIPREKIIDRILQREPEQLDLILNIHFGEHQEEIHYGSGNVTFGIKRGELTIKLTNAEIPLKNIKLEDKFQIVVETELQEERGGEIQTGVQVVLKNPGVTASKRIGNKKLEKIKNKEYQVRFGGGTLNQATWKFEVTDKQEILKGQLRNTKLAAIDVKSRPCHLVITFNVNKLKYICITNGELFGSKDIVKQKIAVIQRAIARAWLDEILSQEPYLSRQELEYKL